MYIFCTYITTHVLLSYSQKQQNGIENNYYPYFTEEEGKFLRYEMTHPRLLLYKTMETKSNHVSPI